MKTMENTQVFTVEVSADQQAILVKCFHAEAATYRAALEESAKAAKIDVMSYYTVQFLADAIESKGKWAVERQEKTFAEAWKFAKLNGVDEAMFRMVMGLPPIAPAIPAGSTETKTEVVIVGSNPVDVAAALKTEADKLETELAAVAAEVEAIKAKKAVK